MTGFRTFTVGEVLTASNVNTYFVQHQLAYKTAGEVVNNSTSLQNDDHLAVAVSASTIYAVEGVFIYNAANTTGDIKLNFTAPSGATLQAVYFGLTTATTGASDSMQFGATAGGDLVGVSAGFGSYNGTLAVLLMGTLIVSTTAGTLQLQWAQNSLSATNTTMLTGSRLLLTRL